jgi:DNA-binding transcriptional regulator GbsR (MarR family)
VKLTEAKSKFIQAWGTLGSEWGINRTMAQIHALLLISPEALSAEDIMDQLSISRGNTNMNLRSLMDWGIVYKELVQGERREFFVAEKDILKVARQITRERRKRELEPVLKLFTEMNELEGGTKAEMDEFKKVTGDIKDLTLRVDDLLDKFSKSDENWFYKILVQMMK